MTFDLMQIFEFYGIFFFCREISNNDVTYYRNIFSTSGCKRISKKVAMYADNYREKVQKSDV